MAETLSARLTRTKEGHRLYQQERSILNLTELICKLMEETGVSRSELARRLGKTKGYISQLLDGESNMTVRTISDVFTALGKTVYFSDCQQEMHDAQPKGTNGKDPKKPMKKAKKKA